ncbi:hypothetical protein RIF29_41202 [Crotalaria pallida]|uniref:Uncharacterized protein n=1 Tax=Crotalaria pallida TaxID=3830 RepID=A0AAN9E589_CROPI
MRVSGYVSTGCMPSASHWIKYLRDNLHKVKSMMNWLEALRKRKILKFDYSSLSFLPPSSFHNLSLSLSLHLFTSMPTIISAATAAVAAAAM